MKRIFFILTIFIFCLSLSFSQEKQNPNIIEPRPLGKFKVNYPEADRKAGTEGTVFIKAEVNKEGAITNTSVVKREGGSEELVEECIRSVKEMKFEPAYNKKTKEKLNGSVTIPFKFKLH